MSQSFTHQTHIPFHNRRGVVMVPTDKDIVRPRRGVFAIARSGDVILLVWPNFTKGIPDLPGGGVDPGETLDQAVAREWREETGLDFTVKPMLSEYAHVRGFYAENNNEFWVYEQTFRLYDFSGTVEPGKKWRNPEGDQASWEKLSDLENIPVNRFHWLGLTALLPDLNKNGTMQ